MISKLLTDETRALIIAFFPDLINLLVVSGVNISEDAQKIWISALTKFIVLIFYLIKTGQNQGPTGKSL